MGASFPETLDHGYVACLLVRGIGGSFCPEPMGTVCGVSSYTICIALPSHIRGPARSGTSAASLCRSGWESADVHLFTTSGVFSFGLRSRGRSYNTARYTVYNAPREPPAGQAPSPSHMSTEPARHLVIVPFESWGESTVMHVVAILIVTYLAGHVRPLCTFAARLVQFRPTTITFFTTPPLFDRIDVELTRNFEPSKSDLKKHIR